MKLDILAIGVHPDDVELGCSGTLLLEIQKGKKVGIVDLTQGELGTRGTVETRYAEAAAAAAVLGIHVRENLQMRDGFFQHDEAHVRQIIQVIRKYRPQLVLANAPEDRHPDHGRAAKLIADACFLSGLMRIETTDAQGAPQERWRPAYVLHYIQDRLLEPDLVIDISPVFEQRMQSILAYSTQFYNPTDQQEGPETYISSPAFYESVVARARMMGKRIGVAYGEGFLTEKVPGLTHISQLIQQET